MGDRDARRRPTLAHQMSRIESSNLRDLLKVREEESSSSSRPGNNDSTTLATVIACEKREVSSVPSRAATRTVSSRTLLDVIKDEDDPQRLMPVSSRHRVSWKAFKDRLRLRRTTSVWSASPSDAMVVAPGSPRPLSILESSPALFVPNFNTALQLAPENRGGEQTESTQEIEVSEQSEQTEGPTRVSLMALLEHEERSGPSFAASVMGFVEDEDEEHVSERSAEAAAIEGKEMHVCCVCMVRHKGAAFIPCGHTFCRLCSRELWISRGNCPLCNGFIHEILDIF